MNDRDYSERLGELFLHAADEAATDHPDDAAFAAYLERGLDTADRSRVEAHLAECPRCRELVVESSLALEAARQSTAVVVPFRWRPALAAAAAVAMVVAGLFTVRLMNRRQVGPVLAALGVSADQLHAAGDTIADLAANAVRVGLPTPGRRFDFDVGAAGPAALRAATHDAVPLPQAPRWTAVRSSRPRFEWRIPAPLEAEAIELLVVDRSDEVVLSLELDGSLRAMQWPPGLEALGTGEAYAWKVSARVAGAWLDSDWVPFRVLDEDEGGRLEAALARIPDSPYLRTVVLAAYGVDHEALAALAEIPPSPEAEPTLQDTARSLLGRMRFPESQLDQELLR